MSNFNEYFRSTGAKMMVDRFISYGVDIYNPDYKITSVDFEVLPDDPYPSSYYIENLLTANHVVKITYTLNDDPEPLYCTFEVPREIDGLFIIEGAYRISTNKLGTDYDCRIKMSGSGEHKINFDFNRVYDIESKTLKIKRFNQTLGINESPGDITYAELPAALENPEKKEFLELTDKQSKKLMIKLDLDFKPEYITQDIIDRCLAFGDDRVRDLIVDKKIDSVISNFMHYLFKGETNYGHNFYSTKKQIRHYFTKENKLQETLNPINTLCQRFFKKGSSELQIPPGVNAVNLDSFKSKVLIDQSVAYNTTMADLIDIADTPINNNTNIQNSLTVSTHLSADGSGVLFDVYTKDFQKITIDYLDYLNSKVVDSECVDYKTKTLKPDANGKVKVKYRMKRAEFPVEEIDLIDLHPDYRLSATTRRIPFVNYTDSVRISMGSSMLKQSIPLPNAERPLVDTGNYDDLETNTLNEPFRYDEGGIVKEINNDDVIIQLNDKEKSLVKMARRTAIQSLNDVAVFTEPKVKVGQKVSKGDIILGAVEIDKDTVKSGVNSLVLFHAYKGLVNEDAVVISESYADRIASYSIIDISMDIKTSQALKWIAPVGTRVKSKDAVVTAYKAIRLDAVNQMMNEKLGSFVKDESGKDITDYTVETYLHVPNNIDDAIVSDVMVQENVDPVIPKTVKTPDYTFAKSSKAVIEKYEREKDRKIIFDKYPEYVAADTLDPINLDNKAYNVVYTVRVRLIKYNRAQVAEKITSRYGGKGVVSKIVADEMMPIINGKRVEVILNPYIDAAMILSIENHMKCWEENKI